VRQGGVVAGGGDRGGEGRGARGAAGGVGRLRLQLAGGSAAWEMLEVTAMASRVLSRAGCLVVIGLHGRALPSGSPHPPLPVMRQRWEAATPTPPHPPALPPPLPGLCALRARPQPGDPGLQVGGGPPTPWLCCCSSFQHQSARLPSAAAAATRGNGGNATRSFRSELLMPVGACLFFPSQLNRSGPTRSPPRAASRTPRRLARRGSCCALRACSRAARRARCWRRVRAGARARAPAPWREGWGTGGLPPAPGAIGTPTHPPTHSPSAHPSPPPSSPQVLPRADRAEARRHHRVRQRGALPQQAGGGRACEGRGWGWGVGVWRAPI
jgi:hypothetical protein